MSSDDGSISAAGGSGLIRFVCVSDPHYIAGRSVPDGLGSLTIHQGRWAYCAAARPAERHEWQEIEPVPVQGIRHARSWKVTTPAQGATVAGPKPKTTLPRRAPISGP